MYGPLDSGLLVSLAEEVPYARRMLVAFSGGLDSRVLLHLAFQSRVSITLAVSAVHIDHGLQADSHLWASQCSQICRAYDIPLSVKRADIQLEKGRSLEEQARESRYDIFASLMQKGDLLLLAHQADDQAETVLLRLLRGAGPSGLAAMPRIRDFAAGKLARPLLQFSRKDLSDYARENRLQWVEDPSNRDSRYDRNFLRLEVTPRLESRFPAFRETLTRSAMHCGEASAVLTQLALEDLRHCLDESGNCLILRALETLNTPRQKQVFRNWLMQRGLKAPQSRQLRQIRKDLMNSSADKQGMIKIQDHMIRKYNGCLYLMPQSAPVRSFCYQWNNLNRPLLIPEIPARLSKDILHKAGIRVADKTALTVRSRVGGESIRSGYPAKHRKLKKIFQEKKIPPWLRDRYVLLFHERKLIAVPGLAVDPEYLLEQE